MEGCFLKHKKKLSLNELNKKTTFLRKQREGLIIGTYRNTLADIYKSIEALYNGNSEKCELDELFTICLANSRHEKNVILDYCLDLEQLGYIKIMENNKILICKIIDF